jgi:1,4-dihydroxy-2-naphthoate octaprenyltransferase
MVDLMIKWYLQEAIEPVLLCSTFCGLLGVFAAFYYGNVNWLLGILAVIGSIFAQISVDLLDDYFDYNSGLDKETVKTPFSGGSELMAKHNVKPFNVLLIGLFAAAVSTVIGIYLASLYPIIIPLIIIGAVTVVFYAPVITKIPFLAEPLTMVNFVLIAVGTFIVAHGSTAGLNHAIYAFVAAGILPGLALLVNIVPDIKVDKKFGRRTGVVLIENKKNVSYYYLFYQVLSYASILIGVAVGALPVFFLLVLLTVPMTFRVFSGISKYKDPISFQECMALNIKNGTLFTILCLVAYLI